MAVFDLSQRKYVLTEEYNPSAEHAQQQEAANKSQHLSTNQQELTHTQTQNLAVSPAKGRRGMSPSKRMTNASPRKSPAKKLKDSTTEGGATHT